MTYEETLVAEHRSTLQRLARWISQLDYRRAARITAAADAIGAPSHLENRFAAALRPWEQRFADAADAAYRNDPRGLELRQPRREWSGVAHAAQMAALGIVAPDHQLFTQASRDGLTAAIRAGGFRL